MMNADAVASFHYPFVSLCKFHSFMRYPPLTCQMELAGREAIYSVLFQELATNIQRPLVFSYTLVYFYNGFGVEVASLIHNIL